MPKSKQNLTPGLPEKTLWHPYSLQSLTPQKFIQVVNLILKGENTLVRLDMQNGLEDVHLDSEVEEKPSLS